MRDLTKTEQKNTTGGTVTWGVASASVGVIGALFGLGIAIAGSSAAVI